MIATTLTLQAQLLCASNAAYGITGTGKFAPQQPYYDAIGFGSSPVVLVAGEDDIDACLIGTTPQGVIVAFRGTIPPDIHDQQSLLDWFSDLTDEPIAVPGIPGKIHEGFWEGLNALWEPMVAEIKKQMNGAGKPLPLYITGHSKGGAMSSLAAYRLKVEVGIAPAAVYTYAAPHPGDTAFAEQYQQTILNHVRYEYGNDIVPHLVPDATFIDAMAAIPDIGRFFKGMEQWDYYPVGNLQFIKWDKKTIVNASFEVDAERLLALVKVLLECQFEAIADAHTSACGGGYMSAVCPTGVCPSLSLGTARSLAELGEEQDSKVIRLPAAKKIPNVSRAEKNDSVARIFK
jgi:hypothetical protein